MTDNYHGINPEDELNSLIMADKVRGTNEFDVDKARAENPNYDESVELNTNTVKKNFQGVGIPIENGNYLARVKKWGAFLAYLEPVRIFSLPGIPKSPTLPIFIEQNRGRVTLTALGCFKRRVLLRHEFDTRGNNCHGCPNSLQEAVDILSKKGYIVEEGNLSIL